MSHTNWQRKDKVLLGVWFEDSFDLTSGLFAFSFIHLPLSVDLLFSVGPISCMFDWYIEIKDTRILNYIYFLNIYVHVLPMYIKQ